MFLERRDPSSGLVQAEAAVTQKNKTQKNGHTKKQKTAKA